MKRLSKEKVIRIHSMLINQTGGIDGIKDERLLESALGAPFQTFDGEDIYKVSMRSSEYVNVSDVCLMFGGGGHPRAAGATVNGDVETVKQKVLAEVRKVLK